MDFVHTENDRVDRHSKSFKLYLLMQNDLTTFLVTRCPSDFRHLTLSILTNRCSPYAADYKEVLTLSTLVCNYTNTLYTSSSDQLQLEKRSNQSTTQEFPPAKQANARNSQTLHNTKTLWYYSKSAPSTSPTSRPYSLLMPQIILTQLPSPQNSRIHSNNSLEKAITGRLTGAAENSVANQSLHST